MSLRELMEDLKGSIGNAATNAPDEYPDWSSWTFETHMADIRELWSAIEPRLKNRASVANVSTAIAKMISAFESGDKVTGQAVAWKLYNESLGQLH